MNVLTCKNGEVLMGLANHIVQRQVDSCRHELNELGFRDLVIVASVVIPNAEEMASVVCRASGELFSLAAGEMHASVLEITKATLGGEGEEVGEGTQFGKAVEA